jgi:hypothetical protein
MTPEPPPLRRISRARYGIRYRFGTRVKILQTSDYGTDIATSYFARMLRAVATE